MKFSKVKDDRESYLFFCPGCKCAHQIFTDKGKSPCWDFNGDVDKPTCSPSLRVRYYSNKLQKDMNCHSYIREGKIQFLGDCTHDLAGQIVEIPEW